jgi:acyl-CoA synthetase (AMP-forming)/AMP-acid ligase II
MIFLSRHKEVSIPEVTLTEFVLGGAAARAAKPALIDGTTGISITYGELAQSVRRVAAGLATRGFQKGDVLAIYSPNCPEYAIAFHAVASLGGINTTINPLYTTEEVAHQLREGQSTC